MPLQGSNLALNSNKMDLTASSCRHSLRNSLRQCVLSSAQPVDDPSAIVVSQSSLGSLPSLRSKTSEEAMTRSRGVPRRGSSSASRGRACPSPSPLIIPISSASPSSPLPTPTRPAPNSSFQNSRFTFRSRLNQPIITFTTTIMVSEEAEEPVEPISSSTPSLEGSLSQEAEINPNPSAMHMQEDSPKNAEVSGTPIVEEAEIIACGPVQRNFGIMHLLTQSAEGVLEDDEVSQPAAPANATARRPDPQSSGK